MRRRMKMASGVKRGGGEREKAGRETVMKTLEGEGISVTDSIKG